MIGCYVVCEGQTEARFVKEVLTDNFIPILQDGHDFHRLKKLVRGLLRTPRKLVTTMIDLHAIASDFPRREELLNKDPYLRVRGMELAMAEAVGDDRFLPHLQLHDFEALVLSDPTCLERLFPHRRAEIARLAKSIRDFDSPEKIDKGHPPAHRIREQVAEYNKSAYGFRLVQDIGLSTIRDKCPHFNKWLDEVKIRLAGEETDG
ncbi:MAG: DUF4276 family protein [Bryobacteraceae bacterium]|nr:DUF4276 family protein [Bryobacteraceae bacterium]